MESLELFIKWDYILASSVIDMAKAITSPCTYALRLPGCCSSLTRTTKSLAKMANIKVRYEDVIRIARERQKALGHSRLRRLIYTSRSEKGWNNAQYHYEMIDLSLSKQGPTVILTHHSYVLQLLFEISSKSRPLS